MDDLTKILIPLIASPILALITALITTEYRFKKQLESERKKEKDQIRLKILHPLLITAEDLLDKITDIKRRRKNKSLSKQMHHWFLRIVERSWNNKEEFACWSNDEGYFAMSSLYTTTIYFYYASKIRRDFPFVGFNESGKTDLLENISEVRTAIGGKYGIWEVMQDSLGIYLEAENGTVKNYRQFCEAIIDENDNVWFNRLIDFYRDIHLKRDDHIDNIQSALRELVSFLRVNLKIKHIVYRLTPKILDEIRKQPVEENMPKISDTELDNLIKIIDIGYMSEVDFVDNIIACIGQELADDYKPVILKHAKKKYILTGEIS